MQPFPGLGEAQALRHGQKCSELLHIHIFGFLINL
jgi:hypothetical protein